MLVGSVTSTATHQKLAAAIAAQELPLLVSIRKALHTALTSKYPQLTALGSSMGAKNEERLKQSDSARRMMLSEGLKVLQLSQLLKFWIQVPCFEKICDCLRSLLAKKNMFIPCLAHN